jgi:hypothetical protein
VFFSNWHIPSFVASLSPSEGCCGCSVIEIAYVWVLGQV